MTQFGNQMRIAITGAAGFIGSNLVRYLTQRGYSVIALMRAPNEKQSLQPGVLDVLAADVTDPAALRNAFNGVDVVVHLAALFTNPEASRHQYYQVNVEGTKNVLEAARDSGVRRVIHCSTVGVASGVGLPPYSETTPYSPPGSDKYETTKCEAERLVLQFYKTSGLPIVVIRPAQVYGPGDVRKAKFYRMVKKGVVVNPGRTMKHLVYVDDLCRAIELAMVREEAVGEIFIIAGEKPIALKDLIGLVASELGVPIPKIGLPATPITWLCSVTEAVCGFLHIKPPLYQRSMDFFTRSVYFDVSKAEKQLGFRAQVDVYTGVAKTAAWYRDQGLL
jgi:nucleoside-diphosphate-sugar epimerase